jgi:hypothetical protein
MYRSPPNMAEVGLTTHVQPPKYNVVLVTTMEEKDSMHPYIAAVAAVAELERVV